ncbi:two-component system sensor histidine kinase NtrB [Dokdonella sp.]|uniref:two-component system sensor histidine kinase NtrB n=1 Tax=Dokdonella sp. TaxID=2291710 RepID=UPI002F42E937
MSPADPAAPLLLPSGWALSEHAATPMAVVERGHGLVAVNPAMHEWLGGAAGRAWRGTSLTLLDARPPLLGEAGERAFAEQRRVWLREARLRTATGDRGADIALTPLDARALLLEVLPVAAEPTTATRLSESLRGFAHEVRGPLAGMRGAAQLLHRRLDANERELAALIIAEVDRLASLSGRLLHAETKPRLARVNVHEVVERVAALATASDAPLRLRRDYDPSLPAVRVDADRLLQALLNLVRNALEAGAHELVLRTRAEHAARIGERAVRLAARIDVVDDGRGVPAELADTLYEPLVSGRADGSGLGLALAREIAREHGGELGHASRPGATVFSLLLPVDE